MTISSSGTGNGATITFGPYDGRIRRISGLNETLESLDDSDLSTTAYMASVPADLINIEEQEVEIFFNPNDPPQFGAYADGTEATVATSAVAITITWPGRWTGSVTPFTLTGTAFITARQWGDLANNELNIGSFTIKWDGQTGPVVNFGADA